MPQEETMIGPARRQLSFQPYWIGTASLLLVFSTTVVGGGLDLPDISLVEQSTVADIPTPTVGEVREFVGAVGSINCSRWEVIESEDPDLLVSACEHYRIYLKRSEGLNLHKVTAAKGEVALEFTPAHPGIQFPLEVGKHWRKQYVGHSNIEGITWNGDLECDIPDFADVTVAAGTFKAFRIECKDRWKVGENGSYVTTTTWYAPDVPGIVKSINYEDARWNTELKSFSR
jgi:hypothetical protein